jgi:hypothetical protein
VNAAEFNALYPIGTPVVAYPGCRPEDDANDERLVTRTRSKAEVLGGHTDVVWVDGHDACIALSHVDVATEAEPITDLATAVEVMGALPMPAGPQPAAPRWQQLRTDLINTFSAYMPVTGATKATDALDELIVELGAPGLIPRGGAEAGR